MENKEINIVRVVRKEPGMSQAIENLLNQLVSTPVEFSEKNLDEIINTTSSGLFLLYYNNEIAGMLTIGNYISPTGKKYWIEDVVVDSKYRGKSLGRALIDEAIRYVSDEENKENNRQDGHKRNAVIMLTSKPARVAANELYKSAGFEPKQTNVYRMNIKEI